MDSSGKYRSAFLLVHFSKKDVFLCLTPENEFGNQLFFAFQVSSRLSTRTSPKKKGQVSWRIMRAGILELNLCASLLVWNTVTVTSKAIFSYFLLVMVLGLGCQWRQRRNEYLEPIYRFVQIPCALRPSALCQHQENIHLLVYLSTFRKNRGFFCASLLLKMHLGINFGF